MSGRHPSDGIAPQLYVTLGKVTGLRELHFLTRLGDRRPRPPGGVASKAEADKVGSVCECVCVGGDPQQPGVALGDWAFNSRGLS